MTPTKPVYLAHPGLSQPVARKAFAPSTPSGANLFGTSIYSPPDPRLSHNLIVPSVSVPLPSLALFPIPAAPKWNEILTWSISRPSSYLACAPEFLTLCILLVHGSALLDITAFTYRVRLTFPQPGEKQLLARQPTSMYFNTHTLLPIYHDGASHRGRQ